MNVRRNFGTMSVAWQDRRAKDCHGFDVTFADGHKIRHEGGCATIPHELIAEHGRVEKAEAF